MFLPFVGAPRHPGRRGLAEALAIIRKENDDHRFAGMGCRIACECLVGAPDGEQPHSGGRSNRGEEKGPACQAL
jgi:hypothetical protein